MKCVHVVIIVSDSLASQTLLQEGGLASETMLVSEIVMQCCLCS